MGNGQSSTIKNQDLQETTRIRHSDISVGASRVEKQQQGASAHQTVANAVHPWRTDNDRQIWSHGSDAPTQSGHIGPMQRRPLAHAAFPSATHVDNPWWSGFSRFRSQYTSALSATHASSNAGELDPRRSDATATAALRAPHRVSNPPMYPDIPEVPEEFSDQASSVHGEPENTHRPHRPPPLPLAGQVSPAESNATLPSLASSQGSRELVYSGGDEPLTQLSGKAIGEPDRDKLLAFWAQERNSFASENRPVSPSRLQADIDSSVVADPTTLTHEEREAQGWISKWEDRRGQPQPPEEDTPPTPRSVIVDPCDHRDDPLAGSTEIQCVPAPYGRLQPAAMITPRAASRGLNQSISPGSKALPQLNLVMADHSGAPSQATQPLGCATKEQLRLGRFTPPAVTRSADPMFLSSSSESSFTEQRLPHRAPLRKRMAFPEYVTQLEGSPLVPKSPDTSLSLSREVAPARSAPSEMVTATDLQGADVRSPHSRWSSSEQSVGLISLQEEIQRLRAGPSTKRNTSLIQELFRPSSMSPRLPATKPSMLRAHTESFFAKIKNLVRKGSGGQWKRFSNHSESSKVTLRFSLPAMNESSFAALISDLQTPEQAPVAQFSTPQAPCKVAGHADVRQLSVASIMASTTTFAQRVGQEDGPMLGTSEKSVTDTSHAHHRPSHGWPVAISSAVLGAALPKKCSPKSGSHHQRRRREYPLRKLRRRPGLNSSCHSACSTRSVRSSRGGPGHTGSSVSLRSLYDNVQDVADAARTDQSAQLVAPPRSNHWEEIAKEARGTEALVNDRQESDAATGKKLRVPRKTVPLATYFGWTKRSARSNKGEHSEIISRPSITSEPAPFAGRRLHETHKDDVAPLTSQVLLQPAGLTQTVGVPECISSNSSFSSLAPASTPQPAPPRRLQRPRHHRGGSGSRTGSHFNSCPQDEGMSSRSRPRPIVSVPLPSADVPAWDHAQMVLVDDVSSPHGTPATIISVPLRADDDAGCRVVSPAQEGQASEQVTEAAGQPSSEAFECNKGRTSRSSTSSGHFPLTPSHARFSTTLHEDGRPTSTEDKGTALSPAISTVRSRGSLSSNGSRASLRTQALTSQGLELVRLRSKEEFSQRSGDSHDPRPDSASLKKTDSSPGLTREASFTSSRSASAGHAAVSIWDESAASLTKHAGGDRLQHKTRTPSKPEPDLLSTSARGHVDPFEILTKTNTGAAAIEIHPRAVSRIYIADRLDMLLDEDRSRQAAVDRGSQQSLHHSAPSTVPRTQTSGDLPLRIVAASTPSVKSESAQRESWASSDGPWRAEILDARATPSVKGVAGPRVLSRASFAPHSNAERQTDSRETTTATDTATNYETGAEAEPAPQSESSERESPARSSSVSRGGVQASLAALNAIEQEVNNRDSDKFPTSRFLGSTKYVLPDTKRSYRPYEGAPDVNDAAYCGSGSRRRARPYPDAIVRQQPRIRRRNSSFTSESERSHRSASRRTQHIKRRTEVDVVSSSGLGTSACTSTNCTEATSGIDEAPAARLRRPVALRVSQQMQSTVSTDTPRRNGPRAFEKIRQPRVGELIAAWDELAANHWNSFVTPSRQLSFHPSAVLRSVMRRRGDRIFTSDAQPSQTLIVVRPNLSSLTLPSRRYRHPLADRFEGNRQGSLERQLRRYRRRNTVSNAFDDPSRAERRVARAYRQRHRKILPSDSSDMDEFVPFGTRRKHSVVSSLHSLGAQPETAAVPFPKVRSHHRHLRERSKSGEFDADHQDDPRQAPGTLGREYANYSSVRRTRDCGADDFGAYLRKARRPDQVEKAGQSYGPSRSYQDERERAREQLHASKDRRRRARSQASADSTRDGEESSEHCSEDEEAEKLRESSMRTGRQHRRHFSAVDRPRPHAPTTRRRRSETYGAHGTARAYDWRKTSEPRHPTKRGYEREDIVAWQCALDARPASETQK